MMMIKINIIGHIKAILNTYHNALIIHVIQSAKEMDDDGDGDRSCLCMGV